MPNEHYYKLDRAEMLKYFPPNVEALLDVGCGEGNFGALVKNKFNCKVCGIEPVSEQAAQAEKKLDKVYNAYFDDKLKIDSRFDVITFNDVLEHMPDPWCVLTVCKSLLKPDGVIIASIPNILYFHDFFAMYLSKDWKYEEAGMFDKTHLRFFTKKSMKRMFQECGYQVIEQEGIRATDSKKFYLFNLCTFGYWAESQFLQFVIKAKPAR